ncbi:hypothetical protein FQR65_LT05531 [Abscondita terminalis]|nr:hypothetical protein FQR65_LT05531 [Abscondita terminalis]
MERSGNFKNGFWMWDEVNNGLLFVSREISPRVASQTNVGSTIFKTNNAHVKSRKEIRFREVVDHLDQARFRRYHQRRCKPNEPNVITIQDIKDVAVYLAHPKSLTLDFIKFFHIPSMDRFLRALIVYFQFYMQVWETLLLRREEADHKLYQPHVTIIEDRIRDDLADLRLLVSREYCAMLVGAVDTRKFHHMLSNKNNVSASDKDRRRFETLICMSVRVVWIALHRKHLHIIEKELNRMLRTDLFNSSAHNELVEIYISPGEKRILWGQANTSEQKLFYKSLTTKELTLGKHDHRLLVIGIKQFEPTDERMEYLEMALSAPEEMLLPNGMAVGLLGEPRKYYDVMLMNLSSAAKRRLPPKPVVFTEFKLPHPIDHSENIPKEFPKQPSKFKDTEQKIRYRAKQLKMWKNVMEKIKQTRDMSILDLSSTHSQGLLSSRSSISMATKRSLQIQQQL